MLHVQKFICDLGLLIVNLLPPSSFCWIGAILPEKRTIITAVPKSRF